MHGRQADSIAGLVKCYIYMPMSIVMQNKLMLNVIYANVNVSQKTLRCKRKLMLPLMTQKVLSFPSEKVSLSALCIVSFLMFIFLILLF